MEVSFHFLKSGNYFQRDFTKKNKLEIKNHNKNGIRIQLTQNLDHETQK